jgi:hypothetical protein
MAKAAGCSACASWSAWLDAARRKVHASSPCASAASTSCGAVPDGRCATPAIICLRPRLFPVVVVQIEYLNNRNHASADPGIDPHIDDLGITLEIDLPSLDTFADVLEDIKVLFCPVDTCATHAMNRCICGAATGSMKDRTSAPSTTTGTD